MLQFLIVPSEFIDAFYMIVRKGLIISLKLPTVCVSHFSFNILLISYKIRVYFSA
jgi:hypothetical protein